VTLVALTLTCTYRYRAIFDRQQRTIIKRALRFKPPAAIVLKSRPRCLPAAHQASSERGTVKIGSRIGFVSQFNGLPRAPPMKPLSLPLSRLCEATLGPTLLVEDPTPADQPWTVRRSFPIHSSCGPIQTHRVTERCGCYDEGRQGLLASEAHALAESPPADT
jgi:hypothetical protein